MAGDETETHMGYGVDVAREPGGLDLEAVAGEAADQAVRLIGARQVPSQRLTLVLEPKLRPPCWPSSVRCCAADAVVKGRTLADRLGQSIASPLLTLVDDPTDPRSMGADTFDGEGLACRRNVLIDQGDCERSCTRTATPARRAGARSTASAVRGSRSLPGVGPQALAVAPGSRPYEELLAGVDHGILVQSMSGLHSGVNTTSGDFSVGAEGLMIRNGVLAEPVREVTIRVDVAPPAARSGGGGRGDRVAAGRFR